VLEYVIEQGLWSGAGFLVGLFVGRMERKVTHIEEKVTEDDDS